MGTDLLYIVSTLRRSGPTNQLYYILKYLDEEFDATVLTLSPEPEDTELPRFRNLDITYDTLGLSRVEGVTIGPKRLRSVVSKHDPDVIHTQGIRADTLSAAFLSKYPRVTTIRNYPYDDYPAKFGKLQGTAMAWEHLRVFNRLDQPVACSKTIAGMVEPHGIDAVPIQNGVDHHKFTPPTDSRKKELRRELELPEEKRIFVSVGSLIPRKDPELLIRGFVQSDLSDSLLLFLGDGPLRESCEELARTTSSIKFKGWVENVNEYLQAADYFVTASHSEGLPNAVMEALSTGLPVCLSDIDPHRELVTSHTEGVFFEIGKRDNLEKALHTLVNSDYERNSNLARDTAVNQLSAEHMSHEYQQIYNRY
ncbi:glycosyltransferase [Natronosalvus vescus]|uniref:glycosyltransferase n=1 Tax=Natronosalvus vescus TaxID=2953881 RepID=UPI00209149B8|nr:glycosyltransferase [Natronosalvus vescus]